MIVGVNGELQGEKSFRDFRSFWAQVRLLIPTPFHQRPQSCCEGRMCRSRRALALRHGEDGHNSCTITEGNFASEHLFSCETTLSQTSI